MDLRVRQQNRIAQDKHASLLFQSWHPKSLPTGQHQQLISSQGSLPFSFLVLLFFKSLVVLVPFFPEPARSWSLTLLQKTAILASSSFLTSCRLPSLVHCSSPQKCLYGCSPFPLNTLSFFSYSLVESSRISKIRSWCLYASLLCLVCSEPWSCPLSPFSHQLEHLPCSSCNDHVLRVTRCFVQQVLFAGQ